MIDLPDGERMAVEDRGAGSPVVLLHGIPGSPHAWRGVAGELSTSHRVLIPHLLGFGESSRPRGIDSLDAPAQARALAVALDAFDVGRAAFAGHDFGGPVAIELLRLRPDAASHLALLATNTFPDTPIPFPLRTVTWPLFGPLAARALFSRPVLAGMTRLGSTGRRAVDGRASIGDWGQSRAIRTIFAAALRDLRARYEPVEQALATIEVPTAVLWGDRDPFFPVEHGRRTADAIRGSTFTVLARTGHFLPEERPTEVAAALRALLGEQYRSSRPRSTL